MNKVVVRRVTAFKGDIDSFAHTVYNNFIELSKDAQLSHNKHEIISLLTSQDMISYLVYNQEGKIIAYLIGENKLLNDGRYVYYITYIFVGQNFRNNKIGSQLMNLLINKCKINGIKYIVLTCDIKDKKVFDFYTKLNFVPDAILRNYGRHEVLTLRL